MINCTGNKKLGASDEGEEISLNGTDSQKLLKRKRRNTIREAQNVYQECDDSDLIHGRKKKFNETKRKSAKSPGVFIVPLKHTLKSANMVMNIIDKIILKFDVLQILRGYRDQIKHLATYNNLRSRRVERFVENRRIFISDYNRLTLTHINFADDGEQRRNEDSPNSDNGDKINPSQISKEYYEKIEEIFKNKVILTTDVTNIDILRYKVETMYFTNIDDVIQDVMFMFSHVNQNLPSLFLDEFYDENSSRAYLTNIFIEMMKSLCGVKKEFKLLFDNDIKIIIENNKLPKINCSSNNTPIRKNYEMINNYHHIKPEITAKKIKADVKPSCVQDCCHKVENLGPLNLERSKWDSSCRDRHDNIECDPNYCGCDPKLCQNQQIGKNIHKVLGVDVEERYAWGIDLFTHRNLLEFLPSNFTDEVKANTFIEKHLIRSLSKLGTEGYNIPKTLEYMHNTTPCDDHVVKFFALHLVKVFRYSPTALFISSRAYSKGIGIFCKRSEGIKQNELITGYYGEIYPPWYWFEKQDLIKKAKLDQELPDFYNIMLERFKSDGKGYDIVMVDPNSKGNFASRMSHSCVPNCNTVLMASRGDYTIGMYATKDISYDEELTFDYNSVTEKEKEFQDAICLCSSFNCRGQYLILAKAMLFTEVVTKYHTFLHRNAILLKSCIDDKVTDEDCVLLEKYAIRSSILDECPDWLKKFAALILRYVDLESDLLTRIIFSQEKKKIHPKPMVNIDKEVLEKKVDLPPEEGKIDDNKRKQKLSFDSNFFYYEGKGNYKSRRRHQANIESNGQDLTKEKMLAKELTQEEIKSSDFLIEITQSQENDSPLNVDETGTISLKLSKISSKAERSNDNYKSKSPLIVYGSKDNLVDLNFELERVDHIVIENEEEKKLYNNIKINVSGIIDNRIQNLAITIDKIKHVLNLIKTQEPPLIKINQEEIHSYYWDKEDSIRSNLSQNFERILRTNGTSLPKELREIYEKILSILNDTNTFLTNKNFAFENEIVREKLIKVANLIKECGTIDKSNKLVYYQGLADILQLYAKTRVYFRLNKKYEKASAQSEVIQIRKRDINQPNGDSKNLDEVVYKGRKEYEKLYIWGQLVGWFKQTVDKPNASLSAERRGTLSYPEIDSFFFTTSEKIFKFPMGNRRNFYTKLLENPSVMWPVGNDWSFKNKKKIYGTVQFDSIMNYEDINEVKQNILKVIQSL